MIYDYILSPHPRRLVFTVEGLPTVTLPVDPALFGDILALVEQEGQASVLRLQGALYHAMDCLKAEDDTDAPEQGESHACL